MNLEPSIVTDSDVYKEGEGYERIFIYNNWDPEDLKRMAQVHIRVDRNPAESYCKIAVWADGWNPITQIPPNDWWPKMPGYLRWTRDDSERKTYGLSREAMTSLAETGMVF